MDAARVVRVHGIDRHVGRGLPSSCGGLRFASEGSVGNRRVGRGLEAVLNVYGVISFAYGA